METDFAKTNIDGAIISELKVVPSKRIVLTLLRGPQRRNERSVQTEDDLQFMGVKDFRIDLRSEPWLQIESHAVFLDSQYLRNFITAAPDSNGGKSNGGKLAHFEIICKQGRMDIIASNHLFSTFNEIPYAEDAATD